MPEQTRRDLEVPITLIKIQAFTMLKLTNYPCWELMWKHVAKKGGNCTTSLFLSLGRYTQGCKRQHKHLFAAVRKEKWRPLYLLVQMALSEASWRRTGNIKGMLWLRWNPTEEFYSARSFGKATHLTLSLFHCTEILPSPLLALLMLLQIVCQATLQAHYHVWQQPSTTKAPREVTLLGEVCNFPHWHFHSLLIISTLRHNLRPWL